MNESNHKKYWLLAVINWIYGLSFFAAYLFTIIIGVKKVEADSINKTNAVLVLTMILLMPGLIFIINGIYLVLNNKKTSKNISHDKNHENFSKLMNKDQNELH